jgi:hypothetical protein
MGDGVFLFFVVDTVVSFRPSATRFAFFNVSMSQFPSENTLVHGQQRNHTSFRASIRTTVVFPALG